MKRDPERIVPAPTVMPIDRQKWAADLDLSNFVNAYYQYRDLQRVEDCKRVLVIGPGQGLCEQILRWRGYEVVTLDIDQTFKPDVVGSVHELHMFRGKEFDAAIASHVLEHLPEPYLDPSLSEIARIAKHALVYLPMHGMHIQLRLRTNYRAVDVSAIVDIFNPSARPDGVTPRYMEGQHYWEVGMKGFRVRDLVKRMDKYFEIITTYRNKDWLPSQNFVLKSRV